jgi:hypothetical protein
MVRGAVGFAVVSVAAFSVWAFGGRSFQGKSGELLMYGTIALVFLGLSGLTLHPLVAGPRRWLTFYRVFVPSFLAYAVVWSMAWFALRFGTGEWLGSLAGSAAFALVAGLLQGGLRAFPRAAGVLFAAHSAGYFLGGLAFGSLKASHPTLAMLSWGLVYGLGFGAGLGYVFFTGQGGEGSPPAPTGTPPGGPGPG